MAKRGECRAFLYNVVFEYDGDECLIWPFARTSQGYGHLHIDGKLKYVHRLACAHVNGDPPTRDHHAAHDCGNGAGGCCNPRHLRWATAKENAKDKFSHGTQILGEKTYNAKLNNTQVHLIRLWRPHMTQQRLADIFGVSREMISRIDRGLAWSWQVEVGE
jgi:hypothetical protein